MLRSIAASDQAGAPTPLAEREPLVSVIMIFLDAERFIEEAITSVFAQTWPHWELLLVDDGPRDRGTAVVGSHAARDPERVRYLEHPHHAHRGTGASRNPGVAAAGDDRGDGGRLHLLAIGADHPAAEGDRWPHRNEFARVAAVQEVGPRRAQPAFPPAARSDRTPSRVRAELNSRRSMFQPCDGRVAHPRRLAVLRRTDEPRPGRATARRWKP